MTRQKSILLVEDNDSEAMLMQHALLKNDVNVNITRACDGEEALNILSAVNESGSEQFSLVLLDLNLPRLNGLEVLQHLQSQDKRGAAPIIMLSSSGREEDMVSARLLGANGYIKKPVDFEEFVQEIRVLTLHWLNPEEPFCKEAV